MDSYDNFDLIGDENLMQDAQDAFKFGDLDADPDCCFSTREGDWDPFSASGSRSHPSITNDASIWSEELLNSIVGAEMVMECDVTDQLEARDAQMGPDKDNSGNLKSVMAIEGKQCSIWSKGENQENIIICNSENLGVEVIGGESNAQTHEIEIAMGPIEDMCSILSKRESQADIIMCNSEIPQVEAVIEGESNVQMLETEKVLGPIKSDQCSILNKGENQADIIISKAAKAGVGKVIGGKSNAQTHEIEREMGSLECNTENSCVEMVTKEELAIEISVVEADSGCTLHNPSPLGDSSPETESVIDKPVGSDLEMDNRTEAAEKTITEEKQTECKYESLRSEGVVGCDGECYVPSKGKNLKNQLVTEGGRKAQSTERASPVGTISDVSEGLLDETLLERGVDDLSRVADQQIGPASPSCEDLFQDAKAATTRDINNQEDEGDCQAGPTNLPCRSGNGSNELIECIGTSQSSHLIRVNAYEISEVPQSEKHTQEENVTAVSCSEKCFEQMDPSELQKLVVVKNCTGFQLECSSTETGGKDDCGKDLSISYVGSLCEASVIKVDYNCALIDADLQSCSSTVTHFTKVSAPTISTHCLDKKLVASQCVEAAPSSDSSSIAADMGIPPIENSTRTKELETKTTAELGSADCGAHTPVVPTPGGCSSSIEKNKEAMLAETVSDPGLDGTTDCIRELVDISQVNQSVEVKAVKSLDRSINEEVNVNDDISDNTIMNDVTVEDTMLESSPAKLPSENHRDPSLVDGTQERDNNSISFGCVEKKCDGERIDHDISAEAEILNDASIKDVSTALFPLRNISECHAESSPTDSALVHSDALERDAEDGVLSVNPLSENFIEENTIVNIPTELNLSVAVDDVGTSFGINQDVNSIEDVPIQLENKMEDGKFSGNLSSEKSTEENYKSTPTLENVDLSFSPVEITPASDMDFRPIDDVLVMPNNEIKNLNNCDGCLDQSRSEDKPLEVAEVIDGSKIEGLVSSKPHDGDTSVDFVSTQPGCSIDDGRNYDLEVIQSSVIVEEPSGDITQGSDAITGSLVEGMRPECESAPIGKHSGAHGGAISTDCIPIQDVIAVSLSHIDGEDLKAVGQSDAMIISSGKEIEGDDRLASKLENVMQNTLTESKDPEPGNLKFRNEKRNCSSSKCHMPDKRVSICDSSPNVELDTMKESQVKFIASDKLVKEDMNNIEHTSAYTSSEREHAAEATCPSGTMLISSGKEKETQKDSTCPSDTMVISSGKEMEIQNDSTHQGLVELLEAEKKAAEVMGASLENAEACSAGDNESASKLEGVLLCSLTESKDPKSDPGKMKEPRIKFIAPEELMREDKSSFESSPCTLGTLLDDRTDDPQRTTGVTGSSVSSPSISEAAMSDDTVSNRTCVEENAKLPDLNMSQSVTAPSQDPLTEAQKMQLRAQIFVYGSLVDGSIPTAAYMERSFEESERCVWEPIWYAYSEMVKNRSLFSSGKTSTPSGSQQKKTATKTVRNGTHFTSPLFDWSPSLSSNFQSSSWCFSPQSGTGNEPLQPIRVIFESEKQKRRKTSFVNEVSSPAQNPVYRNTNCTAAAAANVFTSDFIVQTQPLPISPVLTYARHSEKEKVGLIQVGPSYTHDSREQLTHTCEGHPESIVPSSSFEKEVNIVPICSLDRGRSVSCTALPVFPPQSPSRHYQIAPQASCLLFDQSNQQPKKSSAGASEIFDQSLCLSETVITDKNSSIDLQYQLATADVTVEAVTKAAAAARLASKAARLASEAALQAELLAGEAMALMDPNPDMGLGMFQVGRGLEMVTPAKVLKSKDKVYGSQPIISVMREASSRRVKLASAASKRAENMDTILRAAEMAAEAVSQVGRAVMMGDPLPFSIADMVEAIGAVHLRAAHSGEADVSRREKVGIKGLATHESAVVSEVDEGLMQDPIPLSSVQRNLTGTDEDISVETGGHVIKKGSHVEVAGDKEGHIGVWFGAVVLDLKDGMAQIRYTDMPSYKEEWVPLEMGSGAAPMVRLAHPVTTLKYDGNRKRRREDITSYSWSVGDHVDAHMRDGWWECIIAQKHADEANYTVHFPVRGESLVVGKWELRPSLVWKEGSWVEWAQVKESSKFSKGDSPSEKRQRRDKTPHDAEIVIPKPNNAYESTKIPRAALHQYARESTSSSSEGNQKREETVSEPKRTGPRVCFGVPRPNKKTKFLEVAEVSRPKLSNEQTLVPNSNGQEKKLKHPTKIPEPRKESLVSSKHKVPEDNLTNVRGKKSTTEPVTRKNTFPSTRLGGQNGASRRKGVPNVGFGTSYRAGKTEMANAVSIKPRRSGRKVKPTSKFLAGIEIDGLMSKPGAGSSKGPVSLKGSTHQYGKRDVF